MSINLTITAESPEEFRSHLIGLSSIMQQGSTTGTVVTTSPEENTTPPKRTRKPAETSIPTDAPPETTAVDKEATETDPTDDDAPPVTLEELRAKVAAVAQSGKQPQVKALLTKFESESVSKLPEDKRAAFIKALEAL